MNSLQIIGILGVMFATSFIWYWTGHKDGVREGYTRGRSISRQEFWKEQMKATEALIDAIDIMQDRGKVYGHPRINQGRIAARLSCLLDYPVTDVQAALAMVEVKLARITESPNYTDSYIDAIAYLAIAVELQTEGDELYV